MEGGSVSFRCSMSPAGWPPTLNLGSAGEMLSCAGQSVPEDRRPITKCSLYNVPGSPLVLIVKCGEGTLANLAGELVNFGGDRDTHRDPKKL